MTVAERHPHLAARLARQMAAARDEAWLALAALCLTDVPVATVQAAYDAWMAR